MFADTNDQLATQLVGVAQQQRIGQPTTTTVALDCMKILTVWKNRWALCDPLPLQVWVFVWVLL